jgi:hypothetical protein
MSGMNGRNAGLRFADRALSHDAKNGATPLDGLSAGLM